ncbi:MAG: ABC transporter permease [Galactobacter sp.]
MSTIAITPATPGRLWLSGIIHSEFIKAFSLRSIRWSVTISILLGAGLSLVMAFGIRDLFTEVTDGGAQYITTVVSFPASFLTLVFAVLGVFVFSCEYSSGMILSTLTAAPRRGLVFAAKAVVTAAIAGVVALVVVAAGALLAVLVEPQAASAFGEPEVLSGLIGTVVYLVAVALLAFGVAGIFRTTAASVTTVVGIIFLLPMVLQILTGVTDWVWADWVIEYLPSSLGSTLGYGVDSTLPSMNAEGSGVHVPNYGESMAALLAWVALPLVLAARLFFRRDAK